MDFLGLETNGSYWTQRWGVYRWLCEWNYFNEGWEVKSDTLQLQSWEKTRRVVIVRRRLNSDSIIGMEYEVNNQKQLAFIDGPEDITAYEYAVLATSLQDEEIIRNFKFSDDVSQYVQQLDQPEVFIEEELKDQIQSEEKATILLVEDNKPLRSSAANSLPMLSSR